MSWNYDIFRDKLKVIDENSEYVCPENARELEYIIERAVIISNNKVLKLQDRLVCNTKSAVENTHANLKIFADMEKNVRHQ